jgi:hypothetical protein
LGVGFSTSFNSRTSGEPYFSYTIAFMNKFENIMITGQKSLLRSSEGTKKGRIWSGGFICYMSLFYIKIFRFKVAVISAVLGSEF